MKRVTHVNEIDPVVEDMDQQRDGAEEAIRDRMRVLVGGKGVEKGWVNELEVYSPVPGELTVCFVKTGRGYVGNERCANSQETLLALPGPTPDVVVYVAYKLTEDGSEEPERRQDKLGTWHQIHWKDGLEFGTVSYELWTNPADKLGLCHVYVDGGELQFDDMRTYLELAVSLPVDSVGTDQLKDDGVTRDKIAEEAVGKAELDEEAIEEKHLGQGVVTEGKVADGAVTGGKIAAAAVTEAKLSAGAVTGAKLAAGAVTVDKIYSKAVTEEKLGSSSVTSVKIAPSAVGESEMAAGTGVTVLYESREVQAAAGSTADPLGAPLGDRLMCNSAATEYKVAAMFPQLDQQGPIRKLRVDYDWTLTGGDNPTLKVYLVAWDHAFPPPTSDPENVLFTGLKASTTHSTPGSGASSLELPLEQGAAGKWVWGLVLIRNAAGTVANYIEDVVVSGVR